MATKNAEYWNLEYLLESCFRTFPSEARVNLMTSNVSAKQFAMSDEVFHNSCLVDEEHDDKTRGLYVLMKKSKSKLSNGFSSAISTNRPTWPLMLPKVSRGIGTR